MAKKSLFGQRIKLLREENNLSQEQLAKELGTFKQTISRYELDKNEPNYITLIKIADFFDVSLDYLLGRVDKK